MEHPPMQSPPISSLIDLAVRYALAVAASIASASASAGDSPPSPEPPPATSAEFDISAFNLPQIPDYVGKITVTVGYGAGKKTTALIGTKPCTEALDPSACNESFDRLEFPVVYQRGPGSASEDFFVTTIADRILLLTTQENLSLAFGPIDTPAEAQFVCRALGFPCDELPKKSGANFTAQGSRMVSDCPITTATVAITITPDAAVTEKELSRTESNSCIGRIPEGFVGFSPTSTHDNDVAAFLSLNCQLECAAVTAFEIIAAELQAFNAPPDLIHRALAAALDEIEHTNLTLAQALRHGGSPQAPQIEPRPLRNLYDFALDNATEGCVRETFGVAFARFQAATAQDPALAALSARIADDESRHAQLSWDIAAWCAPQLSPSQRLTLLSAQRTAISNLLASAGSNHTPSLGLIAGVPSPDAARALINALSSSPLVNFRIFLLKSTVDSPKITSKPCIYPKISPPYSPHTPPRRHPNPPPPRRHHRPKRLAHSASPYSFQWLMLVMAALYPRHPPTLHSPLNTHITHRRMGPPSQYH